MNTTPVVIDNITIKQDAQGRYCLNDLHKAAGGLDKDRPVHFFNLETTDQLIEELLKGKDSYHFTPINKKPGRTGGK